MNSLIYAFAVRQFHDAFDVKRYDMLSFVPHKIQLARLALIEEELDEYRTASSSILKLDALCDLIYIIVGTADICGLTLRPSRVSISDELSEVDFVLDELMLPVPCVRRLFSHCNKALGQIEKAAEEHRFDLLDAFKAVHANNMEKLWDIKPKDESLVAIPKGDKYLVKREDGKVIKPPDHKPVDLSPYV